MSGAGVNLCSAKIAARRSSVRSGLLASPATGEFHLQAILDDFYGWIGFCRIGDFTPKFSSTAVNEYTSGISIRFLMK